MPRGAKGERHPATLARQLAVLSAVGVTIVQALRVAVKYIFDRLARLE